MTNLVSTIEKTIKTNVTNVTELELANILANMDTNNINYSIFANVVQLTEPQVLKKCRDTKEPFKSKIQKFTVLDVMFNTKYENRVHNQLKRENKDKSEYKKGNNTMPIDKSKSKNNFFGTYYGKNVIEYSPRSNSKPSVTYFLDGKKVEKIDLPNVLKKPSKPKNQGTDKAIVWRKLYLKNVITITIKDKTYRLIN